MVQNSTVYTGLWRNHARGSVIGSTLTLTSKDSLILVAILALFVALSSSQSWTIISCILHQIRATSSQHDGLHYQQQVTLRNTDSASAATWELGVLARGWRPRGVRSIRRSLTLIGVAVLHIVLFGAAGIFVSNLTTVGNEVLTRSPNCGSWVQQLYGEYSIHGDKQEQDGFSVHNRANTDASKQYVQDCLGEYDMSPQCGIYKRQELPFSSRMNASCPFVSSMCLGTQSLELDTGYLNSRDDLGVNGIASDSVKYRKIVTCSPIVTDGYTVSGMSSLNGRLYNYTAAYYGTNNLLNSSLEDFGGLPNATYVHTDFKSLALGYDENFSNQEYNIMSVVGDQSTIDSPFTPVPELVSSNGSTTLTFVSYSGLYNEPSYDPWLSAQQPHSTYMIEGTGSPTPKYISTTFYVPDKPISVLGCIESHQFCNPHTTSCSPFQSLDSFWSYNLADIFTTFHQRVTANQIFQAARTTELYSIISTLSSPLLARDLVVHGMSSAPPPNQWVLETTSWFRTSLNLLQRNLVEAATGPPGILGKYTASASKNEPDMAWFCDNLILRDEKYTSFSVLGISLIFALGGVVISLSLCFDDLVGWAQGRLGKGARRRDRWRGDSAVQLLRVVCECRGMGIWADQSGVPVTVGKETWEIGDWIECSTEETGERLKNERAVPILTGPDGTVSHTWDKPPSDSLRWNNEVECGTTIAEIA